MKKLLDYGFDVYSQSGEDGILEKILEIIGPGSKVCVEFGAWDGFYLSNTANLWSKHHWKGVLIESDSERFAKLRGNVEAHDCHCIHARVDPSGENTVEKLLRRDGIAGPVDLLSIDIDGDDYYIFDSLDQLKPRIVVCECNPTIPPHLDLVAERGSYFGCSARALELLAEKKGYKLVAVTNTNCIFVLAADFPRFAEYDTSLDSIAVSRNFTYCITGYSGDYVLSREPTYGCARPSDQKFARGEVFRWSPPTVRRRGFFSNLLAPFRRKSISASKTSG